MSHKGTFIATSAMFVMGLVLTVLVSQKLDYRTNTSSFAQSTGTTSGPTCQQCDVNGSGLINSVDITRLTDIDGYRPRRPGAQELLAFCTPFASPPTPVSACPAPTTVPVATPTISNSSIPTTAPNATPTTSSGVPTVAPNTTPTTTQRIPNGIGDCTGPIQPGQTDGFTDILDLEQFRQELNKESQTIFCDFDKNNVVNIIDFTNYIRKGLVL